MRSPVARAMWDTLYPVDPLLPAMMPTDDPPSTPADSFGKIETPLTREALYALVWSEPMLRVAARFDVSSSYMARVCTRMNVPRPERGYWAKHAAGKPPAQLPLPEAQPGDELAWSRESDNVSMPSPLPKPPSEVKHTARTPPLRATAHPLVNGAKALFEAGRLSYSGDYLKPAKKLLVDLAVTKGGLDKALSFASALFLELEESGHRVVIAPNGEYLNREAVDEREAPDKGYIHNNLWSPGRITVVYVGTVAIGLTIIEMSEELEALYTNGAYVPIKDYVPPKRSRHAFDRGWTTTHHFPTGRLCLQAYSPYHGANWKKQWRETKTHRLDDQIKNIAAELETAAPGIARIVAEERQRAEAERRRLDAEREEHRRVEAERQAARKLKESRDDLLRIIERWAESKRIEQFFAEVERHVATLGEDRRLQLLERLKETRKLIGTADALYQFLAWKSPEER